LKKRETILETRTNLVEIDLLRKGQPMPILGNKIQSNYRILIYRGDTRPIADLYAFDLQNVIPSFFLPLRSDDREPVINLQELLHQVYEIYDYDLVVDFSQEAVPALSEEEKVWVDEILKKKGLR
jgi:hypothetical protein